MSKKPTIAIYTSSEGHLSISSAVEQALAEQYNVVTYYERNNLYNFYTPMYQFLPQANQIPFTLSKNPKTHKLISQFFFANYQERIESFIAEHDPVLNISTYFMYNPNLESAQRIAKIPFINVLTDPWSVHPILVSETADVNLAFDDRSVETAHQLQPDAAVEISGWFVRDQFEESYDQQQVRADLKLDPDVLTLLIASGSEGTNMIMKILPAMLFTSQRVQVIVACGNNKTLQRSVNGFQRLLKRMGNENQIIALPFTKEIHRYMQAADLVVGKAGPNTLFESIATLTPFFAITHISGQEDGNLDLIRDYNLGYVEERLLKAQSLLRDIISNPDQLDQFKDDVKNMAAHNRKSKKILQKKVAQLLK